MRLALLIYGSLTTPSGGYLYDRKLVEYFERQGDRIEIISLPWRNYLRHLGDNLSRNLLRRLEGLNVDILLQDELNHPSLFLINSRLRKRSQTPIVSIVHHLRSSEERPAWQKALYRQVERSYLASLDGFLFNSQTTRKVVQNVLGCEPYPPWIVAYPAGDRFGVQITEGEIERRAREPGPLRLCFVGNLIERKNLHVLLDAVRQLPTGSWALTVAGSETPDRAYAAAVRRQAARAGLESQICFLGHLGEADLAHLLRTSHMLVVPSSYEGFGIAYLEGMGFGLPALASTAGAAAEIITHGENGFLVAPGNPLALASCLELVLHERARLAEMGKNALHRFRLHPTWEQTAARAHDFLQSTMLNS